MNMDLQNLSEEDIKLRYITPGILKQGWSVEDITMETKVKLTDGKINLRGNFIVREKPKYADYVLYYNRATPIAIVEAKDATHSVSHGMQQAKEYAHMMDVPFAYSSNGLGFQEYDFLTGHERSLAMEDFPTMEELNAKEAEIRATLEAVVSGENQEADVDALAEELNDIKKRLEVTMAKHLHNGNITISVRLAEQTEKRKILTPKENYEELLENSKAFKFLADKLKLELE